MMTLRSLLLATAFLLLPGREAAAQNPPPNDPAALRLEGGSIQLRYQGMLIFDGRIKNPEGLRTAVPNVVRKEDTVDQVIVLYGRGRDPLEITGTVAASNQAFPCESDRAARALPIVRHSSGLSRSLRNQAVYDRKWDWVLSVDDQPRPGRRSL